MRRLVRLVLACALFACAALVPAVPASADAFGPHIPLTSFGPPGDPDFPAGFHDVVYNPSSGQYLLVFIGGTTADTDDVYGQLLDGGGNPVGMPFRISETSMGEDFFDPATVSYNPENHEYLVAWAFEDDQIFARRVTAAGAPVGPEVPVSGIQSDIETQEIAYSPVTHEYLISWKAFSDGRVFVQRLTPELAPVGPDDLEVGGSADLTVDDALGLAYNATNSEYFIVFLARSATGLDGEEVYAQRLGLDAAPIGGDDVQISEMGPDGNGSFEAAPPSVAWNSRANQYLVTWHGDDDSGGLVDNEREAFGQLLTAEATQIGSDDFRISDMGADGDTQAGAFRPRVFYDANGDQYFLAWHGDDVGGAILNDEFEVYGQYMAPDGTQIGNNDFRITESLPDADPATNASRPSIAYSTASCDYLVAYMNGNPSNDDHWEVGGRRVSAPACPVPPPVPPPPPPTVTPDLVAPVISDFRAAPRVIATPARRGRRGSRPRRTTLRYSLSEAATVRFTLQRRTRGRRVAGVCRKQNRRNRSRPRCVRWVRVGRRFSQQGQAGANRRLLGPGTVGRRKLAAGRYRVLAIATDAAGNRSARKTARLLVVRQRRR
jgi:hypothetical protein